MIIYEYPFNELVRSMLRLEYLFDRFNHFARSDDPELHHNALTTLFELGDISARGDIKSLLLKELERQKFALNHLKHAKEVDQEKLASTMAELEHASAQVNASAIKPNALIGENEWLNAIRTRLHTPGGTSPIDLPGFYAWRHSPASSRRELLQKFIYPMLPWQEACHLFLRLLRESGESKEVLAHQGSFQQAPSGKVYQLMRITLEDPSLFAEISANKYLVSIRLLKCEQDLKPTLINQDIPFKLTFCQF
ncbi:cell division protein ZapD [Polynucleobacter acidiphobus]|uniref:cell division protein ZapD n=1 Tax=Polynucleobacter acidiphobus TaxID=556053 RepID=UPI000D3D78EA|nr:cell division protein ZapD [Polynucleobacter acidiphobus]